MIVVAIAKLCQIIGFLLVCTAAVVAANPCSVARADTIIPGVDEYAAGLAAMTTRKWVGPRTPWPVETPRPPTAWEFLSRYEPIRVHGGEIPVAAEWVESLLAAAEETFRFLDAAGFSRPDGDGALGGGAELDLYVASMASGAAEHPSLVAAFSDGPDGTSFYDSVLSHVVIDPATPLADLPSCVARGVAEARLLQLDPAEAMEWRVATAVWLSMRMHGGDGCSDAPQQLAEPWRSWIAGAVDHGAGGAFLLEYLSQRFDGGTGTFVRDLWQLTRQRTWEGEDLRADPDLWQAMEALTSWITVGDRKFALRELVVDLASRRYFTGTRENQETPAFLRHVDAMAPRLAEVVPGAKAKQLSFASRPLEPYGSGYLEVDVRTIPAGEQLRVWLRGEFGVDWSLYAMRLNEKGRSIGAIQVPWRRMSTSAYTPVELDEQTKKVVIIVTNLSSRLPDADLGDENARTFRVVVHRTFDRD